METAAFSPFQSESSKQLLFFSFFSFFRTFLPATHIKQSGARSNSQSIIHDLYWCSDVSVQGAEYTVAPLRFDSIHDLYWCSDVSVQDAEYTVAPLRFDIIHDLYWCSDVSVQGVEYAVAPLRFDIAVKCHADLANAWQCLLKTWQ